MPAAATTKPFGKFTDREGYDGRTIGVNKFIKYEALLLLLLLRAPRGLLLLPLLLLLLHARPLPAAPHDYTTTN